MASDISCLNSSSSEAKDSSFRSTSSSSTSNNTTTTNYLLSHFIHINFDTEKDEIIPCLSPFNHPYCHCIATLKTPNHHHITCLAVQNNLLYAASGNLITTFDLTTLSPTPSFDGPDLSSGGFIKSIAFDNDHKILTAHQDSKIRVWEQKRHRFVTTLPTVKDKLRRFICRSNYVKVRRNKKKLWIEHNDAVSGLAVNDGVIYSVSWDKTLKIWRASDFKCLESVTAHDDAVNAVTVSGDGTVYTGSADGKIKVWENKNKNNDKVWKHSMVSKMEKHKSTVNALALSSDGRVLLSGGCDGMIIAWEKDDDDRMVENGVVGGHDGAVLCLVRLDIDGHDLFVSGGADRTVRIWGRVGRELFSCMGVLEGHDKPVRSLAAAPSSPKSGSNGVVSVCSGSLDGEIRVWEIMVSEIIMYHKPSCNKDY
ncbi:Protein JINGUBANG [Bienertia sinuspersici]